MIWYWFILALRKIIWLVKIPSLAEVARIDENAPCPICGTRQGTLRTVLRQKEGPTNPNVPKNVMIVCQHTCEKCGAGWFDRPIDKNANPGTVLPSVARNDLEKAADKIALFFSQNEKT